LPGLVLTCSSSQPSASSSASLTCFYCPPWTSIMWHFKDLFKVKFFSQDLHLTSVLWVFKFKIKSDIEVHIKAKHAQLSFMLCFNMDLKIRFYFEFGHTQRTKVECKSCEKNFTLNESLKYHIIEVLGGWSRGLWWWTS
jgi:hypothetical protein